MLEQQKEKLIQSGENLNNGLNKIDNDELECYWSDCYYHPAESLLEAVGMGLTLVAYAAGLIAVTFATGGIATVACISATTGAAAIVGKKLYGKILHEFHYDDIPYEKVEVEKSPTAGNYSVTTDETDKGKYDSEYRNRFNTTQYEIKVQIMVKKKIYLITKKP